MSKMNKQILKGMMASHHLATPESLQQSDHHLFIRPCTRARGAPPPLREYSKSRLIEFSTKKKPLMESILFLALNRLRVFHASPKTSKTLL